MNKREKVFLKTNGRCYYCGCKLDFDDYHIDHKSAKSKTNNDKNNINNLVPACPECNMSKGSLTIEEFRSKLENLINNDSKCFMLAKYYNLRFRKITFYFEKIGGAKCQKKNR